MKVSVIICTHNPRRDYLQMTLEGLKQQTLPVTDWELLLIDNGSHGVLSVDWDLSWHPNARHIREDELGLTPARIRGIKEAESPVLVFDDDDNVLETDYLYVANEILQTKPWLGAVGGSVYGQFESPPSKDRQFLLSHIAVRPIKSEKWGYERSTSILPYAPCGAGMIIRRKIGGHYAEMVNRDPLRGSLDRKGGSLASAGDSDLALCACDMGYAVGVFPSLKIAHLIPKERLDTDYLIKLASSIAQSRAILEFIWEGEIPAEVVKPSRSELIISFYKKLRAMLRGQSENTLKRKITLAHKSGRQQAREILLPIQGSRSELARFCEEV